jgi:transcriptional regulator with XRE-family HTH domain
MLPGERIKLLRLLKGVAQYDLAAASSTRQASFTRVEESEVLPQGAFLEKLANALDSTPEWILEGTEPVFSKELVISDPVPDSLSAGAKSSIMAEIRVCLPSFFYSAEILNCVTILISPRVIINILLFPEGTLLVLFGRNRAIKIIQSSVRKSRCSFSFIDATAMDIDVRNLLSHDVEKGEETLRQLLAVADSAFSERLDVEKYVADYTKHARQEKWEFCLNALVSRDGGLTRDQAMEALQQLIRSHRIEDARIEFTRLV